MKVNINRKQILAWILVFALFLSNLTFGAVAQENRTNPPEAQNETAGTVETEPMETEPMETEPMETEPVETEPVETEPVETEPSCTCVEASETHIAGCPLYIPTFLEELVAIQSLIELQNAIKADEVSFSALTAEDLLALKAHVEMLYTILPEPSADEQNCYDWLMEKVQTDLPEEPQNEELTDGQLSDGDTETDLYADAAPLENFAYTLNNEDGTVLLTKYVGSAVEVIVAPEYIFDDVVYVTVLDSLTVFQKNTNITAVKLYEGVRFAGNTMAYLFNECSNLMSADLAGVNIAGITDMSYVFNKCVQLTTINMTGVDTSQVTTMYAMFSECYKLADLIGYEDWNTGSLENMFWMFNKIQAMETIDLRKWDLSQVNNSTWCFQSNYAKKILLPNNLKTISTGFLNHASAVEGTTFTIPAGVQKIGYAHTIYDFATNDFVEFIVAEGNENYVAVDGILYSVDGKEMLAVPRNKSFENNTFVIPEGVEFLAELSFSRNYNIHTVILPNSYEIVQSVPVHDPRYIIFEDIGNLNASNSLTIAIDVYTGVTDYAVKDDNPRYASVDGIIYSKDMSTVIAVPTRYNKFINLPEGVTTWNTEAIWSHPGTDTHMPDYLGVHIPASLTNIAQDQIDKLNRLNKKYSSFVITIAPENPVYALDENGNIEISGNLAHNITTKLAYGTLEEALEAANSGDTIVLLKDISLAKKLTISKNVTIHGNGYTITRGKNADGTWYAGTLFAVNAGATLTLDGKLTIDSGHAWLFDEKAFAKAQKDFMEDIGLNFDPQSFVTLIDGAPVAKDNAIVVSGELILNCATIQNHYSDVNKMSAILIATTGRLTMNNGACVRHNYVQSFEFGSAGAVCMADGSEFVINSGEITDNYGHGTGNCIYNNGGLLIMNGGSIHHNHATGSNGIVMALHQNQATFIMNGGEICSNSAARYGQGHAAAIYIHDSAVVEVHGGEICHNMGVSCGGIMFHNQGSRLTITGGKIIENRNQISNANFANATDVAPKINATFISGGVMTNDLGDYYVDGYGVAIERKTVDGKEYVYYTPSKELVMLESNGQKYCTIGEAMADAVDGDTLTLLCNQRTVVDPKDDSEVILDKNVTIDLNGKILYGWKEQKNLFRVQAKVTITGNGTVDTQYFGNGQAFALDASDDSSANLTIQNGTYLSDKTVVSVVNGTLNIKAGYFEATPYTDAAGVEYGYRYTLTSDAAAHENGSAVINVTGGTFYGFDPQNNLSVGDGANFVVDKHCSRNNEENNTWTVKPYVSVVFPNEQIYEIEDVPDLTHTIDYGVIPEDAVDIIIGELTLEDPEVGEHEFAASVEMKDGNSAAGDYYLVVVPGTLVVKDSVARITATGEIYETLADAIADANTMETATVEILKDIHFAQKFDVTGNVTIDGCGYTITRDDSYSGMLFDVKADATLTLSGLTIDGGNAWTYTEKDGKTYLQTVVENYTSTRVGYKTEDFIEYEPNAPKAETALFSINGAVVINDVTVQNNVGSSIFAVKSGGVLTTNEKAVFTHNASNSSGTIAYISSGGAFVMNNSTIRETVGGNHGGCVLLAGGKFTMNDGLVEHNYTTYHASFLRINSGEFIMNGGKIWQNVTLPPDVGANNAGSVIDVKGGYATITGGTICQNYGYYTGGINHIGNKLTIAGGSLVDNVAWAPVLGGYHHDIFYNKNATITGGVFDTEIYGSCTGSDEEDQAVTPVDYEEFVVGKDAEGNPNRWEVTRGWFVTFLAEDGTTIWQHDPVREGELPVFEGEVEPREGYVLTWDKKIAPVTESAIYTAVWKPIVAEVVNGDTHKGYFATLQDAVDAAENGDIVRILMDIPLTSKVTVSGKNITLDGNNLTITRGKDAKDKWYTGTLISVSSGASLTVDGKLTIDGGNHWVHKIIGDQYAFVYTAETYVNKTGYADLTYFITSEAGAPVANQDLITVAGELVLKEVTISNHWGQNACNVMHIYGTGSVTMNEKTMIRHNVSDGKGAVASMDVNSNFVMNGGEVSDNVAEWHGGCIENNGGYMVMNGGSINHNYTTDGMGSVIFLYDTRSHSQIERPDFLMNGGDISNNISLPGPNGNANGSAIYARNGIMEMHGGIIHHNYGKNVGGIIVHSAKLTITGGAIVENVDLLGNNVYHDLAGAANTKISGGIFSHDVNEYCETEYVAVPQKTKYKGEFTCWNQAVNGWEKKSIAVAENFTAWVVDKTSINSMLYENQEFGQKHEQENPIISNDSAYTVVYDLIHFYHKAYLVPELKFNQNLPVNTTIILRYTDDNEKEYPYWSDPAVEQVSYWGYVVTKTTDTIPLSAFTRMGSTEDDRHVIGDRNLTLHFVVDFSRVDGGFDADSLDTSLALTSAASVSDQDESYYQSGAVNRNVTENVALIDTIFSLENTDSNYLTQTIRYDFTAAVSAGETFGMSRWDYRERALLVTIPNLPEDARLITGNSVYVPYVPGCYIIPVGDNFSGELSMTLTSNMFPKEQTIYRAECWLYTAESTADGAPLNGRLLSEEMECLFISPDRMASVDVTQENNKHLFTNEESIIVTVEHILSAQYEVVVQLEFKDEEGNYVLLNQTGNQRRDTYMFSLNDCTPDTYRIVAIVKHKTDGRVVTHAPYYFIVE